ncbi:hypothetical protein [Campylobacter sp. 2014D-0216]|uniref:hypothetical protein n=1 Tax=Campylobacter sp. 2014D-0216 TaxID=1813595 RepID=UPI0018A4700B|nr:hypothetical protein [Campylobacter sp. 2014D-0216]QOR00620.1 hypothetical protein A0083_05035 [Campylobacter sp. 2014D-0216]
MKQAFSLLELAFCIVILSSIFGFYYLIFLGKSFNLIHLNQLLFNEEKALLEYNPLYQRGEININHHLFLEYSSEKFHLKSLKAKDESYKKAFLDEKSF